MNKNILTLLIALTLSACSLAPKYEQPKMDLPDSWGNLDISTEQYQGSLWWKRFKDPVLDTLVDEALQNNQNLLAAAARLEQARASWGVDKSAMFPTLSTHIGGSYGEQYNQFRGPGNNSKRMKTQQYTMSVGLNYEIDFWGKFYNLSQIGKAQYLTLAANRELVRLTIISNVITTYFDVITLEKQEKFLDETLVAIEKQLTIKQEELTYGAATPVDVKQMEAQVAGIEAQKANIGSQLINARASLLLLLGKSPREMITKKFDFTESTLDLTESYTLPAGTPADVLLRRPDIYQAEQNIRSANANIGVARASYFPSISLNAVVGALSGDITRLFKEPLMWNAGVQSNAPLFGGGRIIYQNRAAKAQQKEAVANYMLAVQNAYKDVITSLAQMEQTQIALLSATKETEAYKETYTLMEERFTAGQVGYFEFLATLQNYIASQERLLIAQRNRISSVVYTFRSLGGDWEDPEEKEKREKKEKEEKEKLSKKQITTAEK